VLKLLRPESRILRFCRRPPVIYRIHLRRPPPSSIPLYPRPLPNYKRAMCLRVRAVISMIHSDRLLYVLESVIHFSSSRKPQCCEQTVQRQLGTHILLKREPVSLSRRVCRLIGYLLDLPNSRFIIGLLAGSNPVSPAQFLPHCHKQLSKKWSC